VVCCPPISDAICGAGSPAQPRTLLRLLKLVAPFKGWVALSVLLGFATILSGIGLMATSAYLISSAALHPSIASLQVAIVGVRFFGLFARRVPLPGTAGLS